VKAIILEKLRRFLLASKRSDAWNQASKDWKRLHPECAMCGLTMNLEAHDVIPYHTIKNAASKSYGWWMLNFITLDHDCHKKFGHCNDPDYMKFQPNIRAFADASKYYREACKF